jgi:gamma-glutamylputrescine oxidase
VTAPRGDVFWYRGETPRGTPLDRDVSVDAVVVGGGMAGLTCAQFLREGGLSVALLEKRFCGAAASGKSSGFITPASELELSKVIANFGIKRAPELWGFAEGGVDLIRSNILEFGIACDYQVQDSLLVAASDHDARYAMDEHRARTMLGYPSTHYRKEDLPAVLGTNAFGGGVRYPETFGIDSYRYCRGMRDVLVERGVLVFEDTPVTEVLPGEVRAATRKVLAGHVILCADRCIPDLSPLEDEIGQIQTFLAISKPLRDDHVRRVFPAAPLMVWDSMLTYNYFRLTGEQRLLVGGANLWHAYSRRERHDPARNLTPLSDFVARTFPGLDVPWDHVWPGMLGVSKDFLPVAGTDAGIPSMTYIGAAAGLPWAAALGRQVGRSISSGRAETFPEFSPYRRALRGAFLNRVLTRRGALALAHGLMSLPSRRSGTSA